MPHQIIDHRFRDLAIGDRFYFLGELLEDKVRLCRKTGARTYTDRHGTRKLWFTGRKVYGPMFLARSLSDF